MLPNFTCVLISSLTKYVSQNVSVRPSSTGGAGGGEQNGDFCLPPSPKVFVDVSFLSDEPFKCALLEISSQKCT